MRFQNKFRWGEKWGVKRAANSLAWHCVSWCSICYPLGKQKQLGASLQVLARTSLRPAAPVIYVWVVPRVFCLPGTWSLLEPLDYTSSEGRGRAFRNTYAKIMGFINSRLFSRRTSEALLWAVVAVLSLLLRLLIRSWSEIPIEKDIRCLGVRTVIGAGVVEIPRVDL